MRITVTTSCVTRYHLPRIVVVGNNRNTKEVRPIADHGLRLRKGIFERVQGYLDEPTVTGLAQRLNISDSTAHNAKRASADQSLPAPMLYVAAARRATQWPLDAFVELGEQRSRRAA